MITKQSIEQAAKNLEEVVKKTPLEKCHRLSEQFGAEIYLKREDLQEVRSFKIRGAYNKISGLNDGEKAKGVVCASAGNHAQGVAFSCHKLGIKGVIFMPIVTPNQKIEKVKNFGGEFVEVKLVGENFDAAKAESIKYCGENQMTYVHPFDDEKVIEGQGTIAKEIFEQIDKKVDYVVVAIGGGGMISGIVSYAKEYDSTVKVIGVESDTQASMYRSIKSGQIVTLPKIDSFADGTAVKTPGNFTFEIVKEKVDNILLVEDGQIATDMIDLYQSEGIIAEPAGVISVAGLNKIKDEIKGKTVVCIICGGNNDILRYPEVLERSLVFKGLKHYLIINFAQKPGQLRRFVDEALGPNDDIVRFEYIKRTNKEKGPAMVGIEVKEKEDFQPLLDRMDAIGLQYEILKKDDMAYDLLV